MLTETKCSLGPLKLATRPHPSRDRQGGTAPIAVSIHRRLTPSLPTHQVPANTVGYPIIHARRPMSQQTPGSLTGRPPSRPSTPHLLARMACVSCMPRRAAHWRANPAAASSMARNWRAILAGRAFPIDGGTTPSPLKRPPTTGSGNIAATHSSKGAFWLCSPHPSHLWQSQLIPPHAWLAQLRKESNGQRRPQWHPHGGPCHSQPQACPPGGSQAVIPLLPPHTRPAFRTHGGQQPTEGPIQMRRQQCRGPARHIGVHVPHH